MRLLCLLLFLSVKFFNASAQDSSGDDFTNRFALEVQSVDDFFDRFNFRKNSSFAKYLARKYPAKKVERKDLIVRLFDLSNPENNKDQIKSFILQVTDSVKPQYLRYNDKEWYSEITCKVLHQGKPAKLVMILKVVRSDNNGYSWDIVSAKADYLRFRTVKSDSLILQNMKKSVYEKDTSYFLSPVSHGFDFSNMDNVFANKSKINSYIYPGPQSFELNKLIHKIQKSEITFIQVDKIRYHLLQIEGWIMILDYFSRDNMNSGWLIHRLMKASQKEKNEHKLNVLRIQMQ